MRTLRIALLSLLLSAVFALTAEDLLERGFIEPPAQTKPWCYWYWISDNISKEGITKDLEAMARVGIGEALIGNIFLDGVPSGNIKVLSEEWWEHIEHAIREGGRVGVNIGLFNCPGWSQSGGPWIKPGQSMRYLTSSELRLRGPQVFKGKLATPTEHFQDVAVLAFPAPQHDSDSISSLSPSLSCIPAASKLERLVDGDLDTAVKLSFGPGQGAATFTLDIELDSSLTARSLSLHPSSEPFGATCELFAEDADGTFRTLRTFKCDRSNMAVGVGPMPRGPVTVSIPEVTSRHYRLVFSNFFGRGKRAELAEINLSGGARLESYVEKQLGKMHSTPLPMWDTYLWPAPTEPNLAELTVPQGEVRDLSGNVATDGTLTWEVPPGDWIILRTGMAPTGTRNAPASPEGQGREVDKMNRELAQFHFDAFIGQLLKRMPASERIGFKRVVADSYEMGSQNWTDGFGEKFEQHYGYDATPWLPVLSGRIVGSAEESDRFLWDLRRLVADQIATEYVGGLRDACDEHGLELWLENYGHWGFPGEFLKYGSESDRIGGEFWVTGDLGSIECRAASSCANTYGKPFVSAEAFTGGPPFQNAPGALKARGDWSFCEGVNHFVLHVYIQQPWADKLPGVNAWFGTEFNRNNTWFEQSKAWVDYVRRSCWLLQQGHRVADVAYFIGEDTPKMTGVRQPELPPGYDFDYINADVIERMLSVKDGLLTLPHGTTYRVLVLSEQSTMRPELLRKIHDLVKAGATVVGPPPSRSSSLESFPQCDEEVRKLAREVWGDGVEKYWSDAVDHSTTPSLQHSIGEGRITWGKSLDEVFAALDLPPDFESATVLRFTHRRDGDTDIYFVASPKAEALTATVAFRAGNRAPELWWPGSGCIERPAVYDVADDIVRMPLSLGPNGSVFVVFREPAVPKAQRVVSVMSDGEELLNTEGSTKATGGVADSPNNFSFALWVKPDEETTLVREANAGIVGMGEKRNDVFAASHGEAFGGPEHAGCGLAVGLNGVCVFEHGGNYFAPPLVYAVPITNWTHVAVVYRGGQPSLYLDGIPLHTGLKSEHIVHSGAGQGGAQFRGELGGVEQFGRALTEAEVLDLVGTMPRPTHRVPVPPVFTLDARGRIAAQVTQAGEYEFKLADGKVRKLTVPPVPPVRELSGPWEVSFTPGWGAPEQVTFNKLVNWTQHPEEGIRHYSGKATYRRSFDVPRSAIRDPQSPIYLDLGDVHDLATVRVNGKEFSTLWLEPWRVDISSALKPGENQLEVELVTVWNNRLVEDASLPSSERCTTILAETVKKGSPLLPAGLLGPVKLQAVQTFSIE